jgi:hypothetical protein
MSTAERECVTTRRADGRSLTFVFLSATFFSGIYAALAFYQMFGLELLAHLAVWSILFFITLGGLPAAACFSSLADFKGDRSTGLFRRAQRASWVMVLLGISNFLMLITP